MKFHKIKLGLVILIVSATTSMIPINTYAQSLNSPKENRVVEESENLCKDSIVSLLSDTIIKAVDKYYGEPKELDLNNAKILSITKPNSEKVEFDIVVQVETFTGAHNPPGSLETITIKTNSIETKVINYSSKPE